MPLASDDEIDGFGLDEFSVDFLEELERAEEAFPSSFCAVPPSSAVTDIVEDQYDSMFLEPCSQEIADALDEMEQPDFVFSQHRSQSERIQSPASTAPDLSLIGNPIKIFERAATPCSTPRVCIKSESASPKAASSSPPSSPIRNTSSRKRLRSESETDSDDEVDCKKHKLSPPTYLSQFFSSYPKYEYDPCGPASQQFQQLRRVYKWSKGDADEALRWEYGDDVNSLENWQRLCRVVEIHPVPNSLEECQFAIEDAHVNLVDLVDIRTTGEPVHRFATEKALSEYTKRTGKIFPRKKAHKGQLLQHLLRRIFRPPPANLMRRGGCWVERGS
ncbi:hypothetical protein MVEN_02389200 [Mycena venus]|uniref:Uncharacterized protein n=1 Tax=Mycena venus TaxID=2733690 RepID=A0A8H6X1Z3_9AGAR|nr:hypothetical protein MVEN_02389200 [Mycena venus]